MNVPAIIGDNAYNKDCRQILLSLSDYACRSLDQYNDRLALLGRNGFFRSRLGANFRMLETDVTRTRDGKLYSAELTWMQRNIEGDLADCATVDLCVPGATEGYQSEVVTFTPFCTAVQETMTLGEFRKTCADPNAHMNQRILSKLDIALRVHERKAMEQVVTGIGGFAADTEGVAVSTPDVPNIAANKYTFGSNLIDPANGTIDLLMLHELNEVLAVNEVFGCTPVLLSDYVHPLITKVDTMRGVGCCSDKGVDQQMVADQFMGLGRFSSRWIGDAIQNAGGDRRKDFFVLHPGSAQLLEYFHFDDPNARWSDGASFGTLFQDPRNGEYWDMYVIFDKCGTGEPSYIITFVKRGMVFTMPDNQYKAGDFLAGINGIWNFALA